MHLCCMYVDERACENEKIQKEEKMSKISLYNIHILQICYVLSISFLLLQKLLSLKHTHTHAGKESQALLSDICHIMSIENNVMWA